ncbi:MAG: enoyl-CoA hydratase/isomerase family protein [Planctomycetota bacterium]
MQHIEVKLHDAVATVIIDRKDGHAALSPRLLQDIREVFGDLHQQKSIRSVVLMSGGEHFSAGVDLKVFQQITQLPEHEQPQQWYEYWRQLAEVCEDLLRFPKPIVAAVDGHVMGAGLAIMLSCDLVVATDRSVFVANAVRRGLVGGLTAALLAFRASPAIAAQMSLTASSWTAEDVDRVGLLSRRPIAADQIWVAASEAARECSLGAPTAVAATKRMINETVGENLLSQIASAAAEGASICTTESANEGIDAFIQKRDADWP